MPQRGRKNYAFLLFCELFRRLFAAFPRCTQSSNSNYDQTNHPLVTVPDVDLAGAVLAIKPGNGDKDRNVHSRNDWRRWPRRREHTTKPIYLCRDSGVENCRGSGVERL
jgi:hypothetical protein